MKKLMLILGVLLLLSGCVVINVAPGESPPPKPDSAQPIESTDTSEAPTVLKKGEFSMEDVFVGSIKYGASMEEVTAVFGEPSSKNTYTQGATGTDISEFTYKNGNTFGFESVDGKAPILYSVTVVTDDLKTARGLGVGSSKSDVIGSFKNDNVSDRILYAAKTIKINESETIIIPPRGYVADEPDENGRTEVCYDVPVEPYGDKLEDEYSFVYMRHGTLLFFIKNDTVVEYGWSVCAMAE